MARIPWVEERLQRWAAVVTVGDGSGYPVKSVLHPLWQPPSPGLTPTLKSAPRNDAMHTHRAIALLSERLVETLVVHYVLRPPIEEQARMLDCEPSTVHTRVQRAHAQIAASLQGNDAQVSLL